MTQCMCVQDMGVDAVLQSSLPVERGGVLTRTRRGQLCYDMSALTREMKSRYDNASLTAVLET